MREGMSQNVCPCDRPPGLVNDNSANLNLPPFRFRGVFSGPGRRGGDLRLGSRNLCTRARA